MDKDVSADGLRGLAAANVVLCHLLISIFPLGFRFLWPGAGVAGPIGWSERIIALPLLSNLWNGNFPVCIFFVLSGYVLTKKFFATGNLSDLTTKALRRYLRLTVPIMGSVLLAFALMSTGVTAWKAVAQMTGSSWLAQFWNFTPTVFDAVKEGAYRAILTGDSRYVTILWTMKIELIGSFIVFGYAAIAPRGLTAIPLFAVVMLIIAAVVPTSWPLYGGFLAGVHLARMETAQPRWSVVTAVAVALAFGSYDSSPIYGWTAWLSPDFYMRKHLFNVLGGIALVYAVRAGFGARVLASRPVQYLGRISYSLYLVHFPLLLTFFCGLYLALAGMGWTRGAASAVAIPLTFAVACVVASLFQRTFDTWGIALSRALFPGSRGLPSAVTGET
jgi:peptidoglycan/LPS O-acetylase OafA/YrhL